MPRGEYERRILDKFHTNRRWENELAPDWVNTQDLDEEEIQATLQNAIKLGRMKKPSHTDSKSILRGLGLLDNEHFINAALALYGKSERLFSSYPQLSIRLARFRGSDRLTGFAVANAICHRDYTTPGGAVAIAMYDERLEIINPGIFHFDMTPEKLSRPHESKPWNPIIASVFYRAGLIEKWGMGTLNIIEWCKENGNPKPMWEVRAQSIVTTFLTSSFFSSGKRPNEQEKNEESRPESRPESLEQEVLNLLHLGPLSKAEISQALGHRQISGGLKKVLVSLLYQKKIVYTILEKPNSRLQKYKLNSS